MSDIPAIKANQIRHCYGQTEAIAGISFELPAGGWLGLLGPNGSGKTTLFRLLSTLIPLQEGTLAVFGADVQRQQSLVRQRLSVTFQSPALDMRLTVRENLKCGGSLYGLRGRDLDRRIDQAVERFGLGDRLRSLVSELSGGMRRRVELAKSLLHEPVLLLLDEPTSGLDPRARQQFWQTIREQRDEFGTTIVVATHLMHEAEQCDQLLLLDRGRVVGSGAPGELQASLAGERLTVRCRRPDVLRQPLQEMLQCPVTVVANALQCRVADPARRIADIVDRFRDDILAVELARPSLEDVFLERTGRPLDASEMEIPDSSHAGDHSLQVGAEDAS